MRNGTESTERLALLVELNSLRTLWEQTAEGQGGRLALAGFSFQIMKALLDAIQAELAGTSHVLMEAISDIVREDDGFVVAQLKRSLTSGAMTKALQELWSIETLARRVAPNLRSQLRYEIQSSIRVLKDDAATLNNWTPTGADATELKEFKRRVTVLISPSPRSEAARLLVEQFNEARPFELLDRFASRLLAAGAPAEIDVVFSEFIVALTALRETAGDRKLLYGVWGAEDRPPSEVHFEADPRAAVRIGQRLRRIDLREGRLASRSVYDRAHEAAETWLGHQTQSTDKLPTFWIEGRSGAGKSATLLHLLARLHSDDPQRVILWLGSEADRLDEAAAWARTLIREGRQVIVALDDPATADRQAQFQHACARASDEWERVRLGGALDGVGVLRPPVLVCCGPTEQREFAEDECAGDLEIERYPLPHEGPDDLRELADWYELRTRRSAPDLQGEVLLVQRFFEWNVGSIRDFAMRFRQRLHDLGAAGDKVFEIVARILAFGRLYADYPAEVLRTAMAGDPEVERAFAQLGEIEKHLSFQLDIDGSEGVRLTHPHLADAIYREWFGRAGDKGDRRRHLRDGLMAWTRRTDVDPGQRFTPLWAIARLVRERDPRGRRVADDLRQRLELVQHELREVLPEVYEALAPTEHPLTDAPVWALLDHELHLRLAPSPAPVLMDAVAGADIPARGLRLTCHILLLYGPREGNLTALEVVVALLGRLVAWREDGLPWHDWPPIAVDAIDHGGAPALEPAMRYFTSTAAQWRKFASPIIHFVRLAPVDSAVSVGTDWLRAAPVSLTVWPWVFRSFHQRRPASPDMVELCLQFLVSQPQHPAWGTLWEELYKTPGSAADELRRFGLAWLGVTSGPGLPQTPPFFRDVGRVWAGLYQDAQEPLRSELRELGIRWLIEADFADQSWSYVFTPLWASEDLSAADESALLELVENWLAANPEHHGWSFVFHALIEGENRNCGLDLIETGVRWLDCAPKDHAGIVYVLETLLKLQPVGTSQRGRIVACAERWLQNQPDSRGWSVVWQILAHEDHASGGRLMTWGTEWLQKVAPEHASWRSVFLGVFPRLEEGTPDKAALASRGADWLMLEAEDDSWPRLFTLVVPHLAPNRAGSAWSLALARLETRLEAPRWSDLFIPAWRHFSGASQQDRLRTLGLSWIVSHLSDYHWPAVWRALSAGRRPPAEATLLLGVAEDWLDQTTLSEKAWPYFWPGWHAFLRALRRSADLERSLNLASQWLAQAPVNHQNWYRVWLTLQKEAPGLLEQADLEAAQRRWLEQSPGDELHQWSHVLAVVYRRDRGVQDNSVILGNARTWLSVAPLDDRRWPAVWHYAVVASKEEPGLVRLADDWLLASPSNTSWLFVWKRRTYLARTASEPIDMLVAAAEAFLSGEVRGEDWFEVWQRMRSFDTAGRPKDAVLASQVRWLALNPNGSRAREVLKVTRAAGGDARLAGLTALRRGLRSANVNSPCWTFLWGGLVALDDLDAVDVDTASQALAWLALAAPNDASWAWVWCGLWKRSPPSRPQLATLGHDWLKVAPKEAGQRPRLRKLLFADKPRKPSRARGRK